MLNIYSVKYCSGYSIIFCVFVGLEHHFIALYSEVASIFDIEVIFVCFALLCFALLCFALLCFALFCFVLFCFCMQQSDGSCFTYSPSTRGCLFTEKLFTLMLRGINDQWFLITPILILLLVVCECVCVWVCVCVFVCVFYVWTWYPSFWVDVEKLFPVFSWV